MVGEDENRGVERRVLSPPAVPLLLRPRSPLRAGLVASHDLGADARLRGAGESVVDAGAASGLALHGVERAGLEEPVVQPDPRMPVRGIQALPLAGAEPVQRYREVVHPHSRHGDLLTRCFAATRTGCGLSPSVRTVRETGSHRQCGRQYLFAMNRSWSGNL